MHKNLPAPGMPSIRSRPSRCSNENPRDPMEEKPNAHRPHSARGGRPRKAQADRRTQRVLVRMRAGEKTRVQKAAARAGLSVSAYVRRKSLDTTITPRVSRRTRDHLRDLGVRINAVARQANMVGRLPDDQRLDALLDELRAALRELGADLAERPARGGQLGEGS